MIIETLVNILPRRTLHRLREFVKVKYDLLKDNLSKADESPFDKEEQTVPLIKKIELVIANGIQEKLMDNVSIKSDGEKEDDDDEGSLVKKKNFVVVFPEMTEHDHE